MDASEENPNPTLFKESVGERLRSAREHAGLELSDIAARTRIPLRHLSSIEQSDYSQLPSSTYSVGFAKSYARAIGLDEVELAKDLRIELGARSPLEKAQVLDYEPADPARIAPRWLAFSALLIALLVVGGYMFWRHNAVSDDLPIVDQAPIANIGAVDTAAQGDTNTTAMNSISNAAMPSTGNTATNAPVPPTANGAVVLTATHEVWVRIYDANDKVLKEGVMKQGESYTVPADANNPQIRTGAAEALSVTVGGKPVAPLGKAQHTIKDVGVSSAALLARKPANALTSASATSQ